MCWLFSPWRGRDVGSVGVVHRDFVADPGVAFWDLEFIRNTFSSKGATSLTGNLQLFLGNSRYSAVEISISEDSSHYFRTTGLLSSPNTILDIPDFARIRFIDEGEADQLARIAQKRNVFARHSYENSFYVQRLRALSNRTVIEVRRKGDPDGMIDEAEKTAEIVEKISVLSSALALPREKLHRLLGITTHRGSNIDVTIGPRFYFLRSRSRAQPVMSGITVDGHFCKRFLSCGFPELGHFCLSRSEIAFRVLTTINWLFESRQEPEIKAATVKTAIALESVLVLTESESLAQSLSERAAFILTRDPLQRKEVSRILKRFYEARSAVVHGSRKKMRVLTSNLIEGVDRLTLLLCLLFASNQDKWDSTEALREWCEAERWGTPAELRIPFSSSYLKKAIAQCSKSAG